MELYLDKTRRHGLYRDLIRKCELTSRQRRRERHKYMRGLALTGTETLTRARYNALKDWQQFSSSLIYTREGTQFGLTYPPYYGGTDEERFTAQDIEEMLELGREEFHRLWYGGTAPAVAENSVKQAHYADSAIVKLYINQGRPEIDLISDPSDFCVLDERLPIDRQEAMVHFYAVSMATFWRMLVASDLSNDERERIFQQAADNATPHGQETRADMMGGAGMTRLLVSASTTTTIAGSVVDAGDAFLALPTAKEPLVRIAELWIRDDRAGEICAECRQRETHFLHGGGEDSAFEADHEFASADPPEYVPDWRVVTQHVPSLEILYEPVNPLKIDTHAFFPLALDEEPGYCWNKAPMEQLIRPQLWLEQKLAFLDWNDDMQMDPPMSGYGLPMRDGETAKGWRQPGGNIPLANPATKVEFHRPPPMPDAFYFVNKILEFMFSLSGIPKSMRGIVEPGIRSGEQALSQALLGAGPTLARAMVVEDWLEKIGTAMMRVWRLQCARPLVMRDGRRFFLSQMPEDFTCKVWAHSASPIYTENLAQKAILAKQLGIMTGPDALMYLNLPGMEQLRRKAEQLEESQGEQGKKLLELKEGEVDAKKLRALKAK